MVKSGELLITDDELQFAINNERMVELEMVGEIVDIGVIVDFTEDWIQMPGNLFFFRDDTNVYLDSHDGDT